MEQYEHLVIIGNGIAGITTARRVRKGSDCRITIISDETPHFYSRTALMYIYMGDLRYEDTKPYEDWFWAKNRLDLVHDRVVRILPQEQRICLQSGAVILYSKLILATGSRWKSLGWEGHDAKGVQGLYSFQDLQNMYINTQGVKQAVVVGGGLIGVEVAEMLHARGIHVTFLVREWRYWNRVLPNEEAEMISQHLRSYGIDLRFQTELRSILRNDEGRVCGIITSQNEEIACEFLALTIGVEPRIEIAREAGILCERGVVVNELLETSVPNVYAAGDCAEIMDSFGNKRVEQLWYTGKMQGKALAQTLLGMPTRYERGILFNSAKFFDIEYQTYGLVNAGVEGEESIFWRDRAGKRSIRLVYTAEGLIGVNVFGVRYRHRVCEAWIREKRSIEYVLEHLSEANFDPEFSERCEHHLIAVYKQRFPHTNIRLAKKRGAFRM